MTNGLSWDWIAIYLSHSHVHALFLIYFLSSFSLACSLDHPHYSPMFVSLSFSLPLVLSVSLSTSLHLSLTHTISLSLSLLSYPSLPFLSLPPSLSLSLPLSYLAPI